MTANFTYDSYYSPANSFRKVQFGGNAPVLETDLNELQDILRHNLDNFLKTAVGSGVVNTTSTQVNGNTLTLNDFYVLVDGILVELNPITTVPLPSLPSAGMITYLVFLESWSQTVNSNNIIYDYGQWQGTTISNYLIDPRIGFEVSERLEQLWRIRVVQNDFVNYPNGFQNPSITAQAYYSGPTAINYQQNYDDPALYSATLPDGTLVYALGLFQVQVSSTGYTVIDAYHNVSIHDNLTQLQTQLTTLATNSDPFPQYILDNDLGTQFVQGSLNLAANLTVNQNLLVNGNFTVSGTITSTSSQTYNVGTQWIYINENETGTPSLNAGLVVTRGTSPDVTLEWNESAKHWELSNDGLNFYPIIVDADGITTSGTVTFVSAAGSVGYLGGSHPSGTLVLGSHSPGTTTYALWNDQDDIAMNLNLNTVNATQNGIFGAGIITSGTSTLGGPLVVNASLTLNDNLTVNATSDNYVNGPSMWVGNAVGYLRFTGGSSGNQLESFNVTQNGNQILNITGPYGNTGSVLGLNFNTINTIGMLNVNGITVNDNTSLYFGPPGDNQGTVKIYKTIDTPGISGLHVAISSYLEIISATGNLFRLDTLGNLGVIGSLITTAGLYVGDVLGATPTQLALLSSGTSLLVNPTQGFTNTIVNGALSATAGLAVSGPTALGNIYLAENNAIIGYDGGKSMIAWFQHTAGTNTNIGTTVFVDANGNELLAVATDGNTQVYGNLGVNGTTNLATTSITDGSFLLFGVYNDNTSPIYLTRTNDATGSSGLHLYVGSNAGFYPSYLQAGGIGDYLQVATTNGQDIIRGISTGDVFIGRNLVVPNTLYMGTGTTTMPTLAALSTFNNELVLNPTSSFSVTRVGSDLIVGNGGLANAWIDVHAVSDHGYMVNQLPVLGNFPGWNNGTTLWLNTHSTGVPHPSFQAGVTTQGSLTVIGGNVAVTAINAPLNLAVNPTAGASYLVPGTTYYYGVTAVTQGETPLSNVVLITPPDAQHVNTLTWDDTEGAYSYNIYRGLTVDALYQLITNVTTNTWSDNGSLTLTSITPPTSNTTGGIISAIDVNATNATITNLSTTNLIVGNINGTAQGLMLTAPSSNQINGNTDVVGNAMVNGVLYFGTGQTDISQVADSTNNTDPVYMYLSYDAPNQTGLHLVLADDPGASATSGRQDYFTIETNPASGNVPLLDLKSDGKLTVYGNMEYRGNIKTQLYALYDASNFLLESSEIVPDPLSTSLSAVGWSPANNNQVGIFIVHTGPIPVRFGEYALAVRARFGPFVQDNSVAASYQAQALNVLVRYYYNNNQDYFDVDTWFDSNQFAYGTSYYYQGGNVGEFGSNTYDTFYTTYVEKYYTTYSEGQTWVNGYWAANCSDGLVQNFYNTPYDNGAFWQAVGWNGVANADTNNGQYSSGGCSWLYHNGYWQYYYYPVTNAVWTPILNENQYYIDYTNFYTSFIYQRQMTIPGTNTLVMIDSVDIGIITNQDNYTILVDSLVIQPVHPGVLGA